MNFQLPKPVLRLIALALIMANLADAVIAKCADGSTTQECAYMKHHPDYEKSNDLSSGERVLTLTPKAIGKKEAGIAERPLKDKSNTRSFGRILYKMLGGKKKPVPKAHTDELPEEEIDADDSPEEEPEVPELKVSDTFGFDFGANIDFSVEDPEDMKKYFEQEYFKKQEARDAEHYDYFNVLDDIANASDDEYDKMEAEANQRKASGSKDRGVSALDFHPLVSKFVTDSSQKDDRVLIKEVDSNTFIQFPSLKYRRPKAAPQPTPPSPLKDSKPNPDNSFRDGLDERGTYQRDGNLVSRNRSFDPNGKGRPADSKEEDDESDEENEGERNSGEKDANEYPKRINIGHPTGIGSDGNNENWSETFPTNPAGPIDLGKESAATNGRGNSTVLGPSLLFFKESGCRKSLPSSTLSLVMAVAFLI